MKTILAVGAFAFATAAGAQTTGTQQPRTPTTTQPGMQMDHSNMQHQGQPMSTTNQAPPPRANNMPASQQGTPYPQPVNNMGNPQPMPQPNPVNNPVYGQPGGPVLGATQPTPMAAPPSVGPGEYQVCTKQVTDRCINPNDIRRGIAQRPANSRATRTRSRR